ncbi:hypothetical protein, partial [Hymenobacter agri]
EAGGLGTHRRHWRNAGSPSGARCFGRIAANYASIKKRPLGAAFLLSYKALLARGYTPKFF